VAERRVLKYRLPPVGYAGLATHGDPIPRAVGWQGRQLVAWMEVDTDAPVKIHGFGVVMTGDPVPTQDHATVEYVGTAQLDDGEYVVHVYRWMPRG
jgi:hypothetical protein